MGTILDHREIVLRRDRANAVHMMALTVAHNVRDVVVTSSPGWSPAASTLG
jgi:hypothetical protein